MYGDIYWYVRVTKMSLLFEAVLIQETTRQMQTPANEKQIAANEKQIAANESK